MFLNIKRYSARKNNIQTMSDEELILNYKQSKNPEIIGELFERYTHLVLGVCMKYLKNEENSKDAVMEIFENLQNKLLKHNITHFKSWIYTVAKNHCLMIHRKNKSAIKINNQEFDESRINIMESDPIFHPIFNKENEDQIHQLEKGIKTLNDKQRTCIELLYLQNKSYKEVVEITGYDLKKVKSYIQNGKRNLKIYLENK